MRKLAVRRLAGAFLTLAALVLVGLLGWGVGGWSVGVAVGVAVGGLASAVALVVVGQRAVRSAFGLQATGWWRISAIARAVPGIWSLWVLIVPAFGRGRISLAEGRWLALAASVVAGGLALRTLVVAHRVGELESLADTMAIPAADPDEADDAA